MRCPRCGYQITPHDRFCGNCGDRLAQLPQAAKTKKPLLPRLSPKQLRVAGGVLAGVIIICLLLVILPGREKRKSVPRPTDLGAELIARPPSKGGAEIGVKAVYGKVIFLQRGSITIQTLSDRKEYSVYVGHRTRYEPRRYPAIGDKIKVLYIEDRGQMKATQIEIQQ